MMRTVTAILGPNEVVALRDKATQHSRYTRLSSGPPVDKMNPDFWFHSKWMVIVDDSDIFTVIHPVGWLQDGDTKYLQRYHPSEGLYLRYDECTDFKVIE